MIIELQFATEEIYHIDEVLRVSVASGQSFSQLYFGVYIF